MIISFTATGQAAAAVYCMCSVNGIVGREFKCLTYTYNCAEGLSKDACWIYEKRVHVLSVGR